MLKLLPTALILTLAAFAAGGWLLATRPAAAPPLPESVELTAWKFEAWFELAEVPEPSGMCFVAETGSLFVVDDGGAGRQAGVYEVSLDGAMLRGVQLGRDLEGICYCPPERTLHVADEAGERVWVLDLDTLATRGSYIVSRSFEGAEVLRAGGNGFEGIEYIASTPAGDGDFFLLLNQDDPHALVRVERAAIVLDAAEPVGMTQFTPLPKLNLGELHYDAATAQLWVVNSWQNVYQLLDIDTLEQVSWQVMPGVAQEAVCFDGQGRLWIGSDTGGLSVYSPAPAPADAD